MLLKTVFLYPDYFDNTTATRRVLETAKDLFPNLEFFYWERAGVQSNHSDPLYEGIKKTNFKRLAPPRSVKVLLVTLQFQWWLLRNIRNSKPQVICAFYIYTILPALVYKYFFNRSCKVIYDPRDYFAVVFRLPAPARYLLKLIDNIFIKLSDRVLFPDQQFFTHYGLFKIPSEKYFILPNSTTDKLNTIKQESLHQKLGLSIETKIVPIIGYFSEDRGRKMFFEAISQKPEGIHFVVAGAFRDVQDIAFFKSQSNVSYLGKVPYLEALWIMEQSAIVPIVCSPDSLNYKFAIPTKFYDSTMVGTPVLVSDGQVDVAEKINANKLGFCIPYNDANAFQNVLYALPKQRDPEQSNRIRQYFLEKYDFVIFKSGLRRFYESLQGDIILKTGNGILEQ
jgi:glycosyltransferase involved in cell wall biosynthesis